ncbi:hypothetical protein K437DRAFT_256902 [Tilletiaria anomala UBC 951]|uniref:Polynucleotide 5'-hydroxyl-kinase GRC3 n=1 Tax=Tilletiaria anomala (strain ATCC 24038 / CBS 436.72 / UBC 951) TaxID=1037660 RepID=A0A066VSP5_TILAU|nr:uncharacterized protein K437DRAFT_256902 [Tilletiaria anomala UBC 951]KDN44757.1 hypothetical protein K437DRAFT_256902 [Tilletiaria anomala UBC 951]
MMLSAVAARKAKAEAEAAAHAQAAASALQDTGTSRIGSRKKPRLVGPSENDSHVGAASGLERLVNAKLEGAAEEIVEKMPDVSSDEDSQSEEDDVESVATMAQVELLSLEKKSKGLRYFAAAAQRHTSDVDDAEEREEEDSQNEEAEGSAEPSHETSEDDEEGDEVVGTSRKESSDANREDRANSFAVPVSRRADKSRARDVRGMEDGLRILTTWQPCYGGKDKNCIPATSSSGEILIGMKEGETLAFVGVVRLKVLRGVASISGAHVQSTSQGSSSQMIVIAPHSNTIPVITAVRRSDSPISGDSNTGVPTLGPSSTTVLCIQPHHMSGIQDIGLVCPLPTDRLFEAEMSYHYSQLRLPLFCPVEKESRLITGQQTVPAWDAALDMLAETCAVKDSEAMTVLVRGPKRVGKSTIARMALNRLITTRRFSKVAFLDLDLGQTEFGPPGIVSLHVFDASSDAPLIVGPCWCTARQPLRAHFVGDVSPTDAPQDYMQAVLDLLDHFLVFVQNIEPPARRGRRAEESESMTDPVQPNVPLIVNTMGWVKGLGADLLAQLEDRIDATHIFDFMADSSVDVMPISIPRRHSNGSTLLVPLPLFGSTSTRHLAAADTRTLSMMSYLHMKSIPAAASHELPMWDFHTPVIAINPYQIDLKYGFPAGVHILPFGAAVPKVHQLAALDCSICAIVEVAAGGGSETSAHPAYEQSTCIGLALIRSISQVHNQIELLTPISPTLLNGHIGRLALVKGAIPVPIWAFLDRELVQAAKEGTLAARPGAQLSGVPFRQVPYLDFPIPPDMHVNQISQNGNSTGPPQQIMGTRVRKLRKNVMRKGQRAAMQAAGSM